MEETNCFPALPLAVPLAHVNAENLTRTAAIVQHRGLGESQRKKCTVSHCRGLTSYTDTVCVMLLSSTVELSNYSNRCIKKQNFNYTLQHFSANSLVLSIPQLFSLAVKVSRGKQELHLM